MNVLDRIDAALDGLCPCGAEPRDGSAYCSTDCEPTHIAEDTDAPDSGTPTPMRWRPDLVTAADDSDLIPLGSETHGYTGRYNAQVYEKASDPTIWHLRLDDGHRFVGVDLTDVGGRQDPIGEELVGRVREAWQRLEQELTNPDHAFAGWTDVGYVDETDDPWADVMPGHLNHAHFHRRRPPRRSYHAAGTPAVDASALFHACQQAARSLAQMAPAVEEFAQRLGVHLTAWQRQVLAVQLDAVRLGFRPLVNAREATVLSQNGLREGVDFLRYGDAAAQDGPPTDPMARALWLRQRRNTGPPADRLDGRRRQRR